jgi:hypothetical protein
MSTRYKIRSPIDIWTAYGGDQQRIAQAMQLGVIRPEEGVLAVMEGKRKPPPPVAQGTVAQQVMGIVPPPTNPMASNMGAPAPQPAPPMQAPMGAPPMQAPMGAPPAPMPGMAMGGVASLPIPGAMFDEPDNGGYGDGYSGGGLVAFAGGGKGGMSDLYDDVEYWESGGNQDAVSSAGARGVMQLMPGTMRDPGFGITPMKDDSEAENRRVGQQYLDAMYRKYGDRKLALMAYNWGPGNVDKWIKSGAPANKVPKETREYVSRVTGNKAKPPIPERDLGTAEGRAAAPMDIFGMLQDRFGPSEESRKIDERRMARAEEMASDEYYEQQRKDSVDATLTAIGFNMASSKSPYLLQAVGEAAAAAAPGARADKKERKALQDRALDIMGQMNDKTRKENLELLGVAIDMSNTGMKQEQFEEELEFRKNVSAQEMILARRKLNAEIAALENKGADVNTTVFQMFMSGDKAMKKAAEEWLRANGKGMSPLVGEEGGASSAGPWTQYQ